MINIETATVAQLRRIARAAKHLVAIAKIDGFSDGTEHISKDERDELRRIVMRNLCEALKA